MREYTSTPKDLGFKLDGVVFAADSGLSLFDLTDLARFADLDAASAEGMAALEDFFTELLGAGEFARFKAHCKAHKTEPDKVIQIVSDLLDDMFPTAFPTQPPSDSPDGPSSTGPTLRVISSSPDGQVLVTEKPLDPARAAELREAVARAEQSA